MNGHFKSWRYIKIILSNTVVSGEKHITKRQGFFDTCSAPPCVDPRWLQNALAPCCGWTHRTSPAAQLGEFFDSQTSESIFLHTFMGEESNLCFFSRPDLLETFMDSIFKITRWCSVSLPSCFTISMKCRSQFQQICNMGITTFINHPPNHHR